jgi:hypothetical protein
VIRHPAIGQVVRLRYRKGLRPIAPHHDRIGTVVAAARVVVVGGKRSPRNHLVRIGGELVCVPAGHLMAIGEATSDE